MANPLNGRVKRLESSANRFYAFLPEGASIEEWLALHSVEPGAKAPDLIYELKSLSRTGYVRRYTTQIRRGTLEGDRWSYAIRSRARLHRRHATVGYQA